ncbi:bifunctional oligoribonuclease/PAP phosphatase NrnA [Patescibacteria group bacterium]|nr:bifunctional oligoribonuclease/PAP phosphatase NrnA [Patescibacteria group bacterium]MBU1921637.1 bifunctional oligoribonuclease/PAP phosphatase NrnA [Patescibacteria group bacterium]
MVQEFIFHKIYDSARRAKKSLLVMHKKPDGDTLGSALAFSHWLDQEGKEVKIFCRDLPSPYYDFLAGLDRITDDPRAFTEYEPDLIIALDSGDLDYAGVGEIMEQLEYVPTIINIDHHKTNQNYGAINAVDPDSSSTAELVYDFFKTVNIKINKSMATALLVGVLTDTGNFSNPATTFGSMRAASELVAAGARTNEISKNLLKNKSIDALRLWGKTLARLEENKKLNMAFTVIKHEDIQGLDSPAEAVEGVANFLNRLLDVDLILVLQENAEGAVKGSFRSTNVDVSRIAQALGGGGHKRAAGFSIQGKLERDGENWQII